MVVSPWLGVKLFPSSEVRVGLEGLVGPGAKGQSATTVSSFKREMVKR